MLREKVYKRQVIVKRSKREQITDAFSRAWRDGTKFSITLDGTTGQVHIWQGRSVVAIYTDATDFAHDFMPEILDARD